jgi:hypothetical protein
MAGRAEVAALNREAIGLILMIVAIFNPFVLSIPSQFSSDFQFAQRRKVELEFEVKTRRSPYGINPPTGFL